MKQQISIDLKKFLIISTKPIMRYTRHFYILLILSIFLTVNSAKGSPATIVALVNNEPITLYEFQMRKKMVITLNNVHNPDAKANAQINTAVLNSLIEEQLLFQHSKKVGGKISATELEEAIITIAQRNKMSKEDLFKYLSSQNIDIDSFRKQITAELIKINILSYISRSVTISPQEIDAAILLNNSKDAKISARIFTSKDKTPSTLQKMYSLHKTLKTCNEVRDAAYSKFATAITINENLSTLDHQLQTIIRDLSINQKSSVFETTKGFQLVLMCTKVIDNVTSAENDYITNFLTNKKMSQKAQKFFEDLRKKAYIKIML